MIDNESIMSFAHVVIEAAHKKTAGAICAYKSKMRMIQLQSESSRNVEDVSALRYMWPVVDIRVIYVMQLISNAAVLLFLCGAIGMMKTYCK